MSEVEVRSYIAVLQDGRTVGYYMNTPPRRDEAIQDYVCVTIPTQDAESARELQRHGFRFAERNIAIEIQLRRFRSPFSSGGGRFRLIVTDEWAPEEIYSLAERGFERDCRFAVDMEQVDRDMKNELLQGFIGDLREKGTMATCLYGAEGLEGFNLWKLHGGDGRIMLGAVGERYRGTGVALSLYAQTVNAMREREAGTLRDIVASTNTASLNLHAMLIRCAGGLFRFNTCLDQYKRERVVSA